MSGRLMLAAVGLAAVVALSGCRFIINEGVRGDGDVVTVTRDVDDIEAVRHACQGDLVVKLGERESLVLEGERNLLEHVVTEVHGGTLTIRNERGINLRPTERLRFTLTVRDLKSLCCTGSGDVRAPRLGAGEVELTGSGDVDIAGLDASRCDLQLTGSGGLDVGELETERLEVRVTGSGDLKIEGGRARRVEVEQTGSGDVRARDLAAEEAEVRLSGSGGLALHVDESLKGRVSGSGGVRYGGSPRVDVRATGSGRVSRR